MRRGGSVAVRALAFGVVAAYGGFVLTLGGMSQHRLYGQDTVYFSDLERYVELTVELADEHWGYTAVSRDLGALYLYPTVRDRPLSGRGRLREASVALLDRQGTVLRIVEVPPCGGGGCPLYPTEVAYRGRLEVEGGWFRRNGVAVGSRVDALSLRQLRLADDH